MSGAELYLVAMLVSAGAKYASEKSKAKGLRSQAYQTEIKGRVDRANYKQQGIEVLKETNKIMSANIASAFSANMDPFKSGETPDVIQSYSMRAGMNDFSISRDNASIVMKQASYQAETLRASARDTIKFAKIGLVADVAMAGYGYSTIGSAPATSSMATSSANTSLSPTYARGMTPRFSGGYTGNARLLPTG
jgi:hypothetical protein